MAYTTKVNGYGAGKHALMTEGGREERVCLCSNYFMISLLIKDS